MKIATVIISNRPTLEQKQEAISNSGNLFVDFIDEKTNKLVTVDYAQLFRDGGDNLNAALAGVATFNAVEYFLDNNLISLLIKNNDNSFILKTNKVVGINNESEDFTTLFNVILKVTNNTGKIINPLKTKDIQINVNGTIKQTEKDYFQSIGCVITGDKWNNFSLSGSCLIQFQPIEQNTVFVGYNQEGYELN